MLSPFLSPGLSLDAHFREERLAAAFFVASVLALVFRAGVLAEGRVKPATSRRGEGHGEGATSPPESGPAP